MGAGGSKDTSELVRKVEKGFRQLSPEHWSDITPPDFSGLSHSQLSVIACGLKPNGDIKSEFSFAAGVDLYGRLQRKWDDERKQCLKDAPASTIASSHVSDPSPEPKADAEEGAVGEVRQRPGRQKGADKNQSRKQPLKA
ncbi:unnamed protein product [Vitrella brassicaformis CCMP3155]|uniref:Uncharacterized protein n=2 Tax=Vitrella brassicaformis TaxID=1169539 RepID=A0A0G4EWA5_VITBC|nr:unnamed protein product [Vitrella brassicaformis CCMP3155]|mmetsp:Transcript_4989/g.11650  ORF Transcript_4989/g.11650 Transcript_4989/m.11650 type:complete len:140 (+) Transcript_4989:23-442(+)|eukprot:CEM02630.1 unnamed protein product [Vitrella brassicaformis CCMP3155]